MENIQEKDIFLSDLNFEKAKETHLPDEKRKRSKLWHTFINIKMFTIVAGIANIPVYSASLLLSSQLTSIEKHFGISSSKSAGLISANEIGFLITVLPFGYVFKRSHKPFILAISNIGSAIACFICTLPYFFLHMPKTNQNWNVTNTGSLTPLFPCMNINVSYHQNTMCATVNAESQSTTSAYALLFLGMIIGGICKAVRSPLVACYIDDNINRAYIGGYMSIMSSCQVLGFVIAFTLGGYFSQIFVTLQDTYLTPMDPNWIGAWWLGFATFSVVSLVMSLPLFAFPRSFNNIKYEEREKTEETKLSFKGIAKTLLRMIRNPSVMLISLFGVLCVFNVSGKLSFLPKYYETQFGWPAWQANVVIGATYITMFMLGIVISGCVTSYFKLDIPGSFRMTVLVLLLHVCLSWLSYNLTCPKPDIVKTYISNHSELAVNKIGYNPQHYCLDCECSEDDYSLVCGEDGRNYKSACYASCQYLDMKTFQYSNCSCISGNKTANFGACPTNCKAGLYLTIFISLHSILIGMTTSPHIIILMRSVLNSDKSMAISVTTFLCSIFGFFPGPPLFGLIVDNTCTLWNYLPCGGGRGYCKTYDIDKFRMRFFSLLGTIDLLSFLSVFLAAIISHFSRKKAKKSGKLAAIQN